MNVLKVVKVTKLEDEEIAWVTKRLDNNISTSNGNNKLILLW